MGEKQHTRIKVPAQHKGAPGRLSEQCPAGYAKLAQFGKKRNSTKHGKEQLPVSVVDGRNWARDQWKEVTYLFSNRTWSAADAFAMSSGRRSSYVACVIR